MKTIIPTNIEDAVSPVVGVMLMLVVTIIIAAVVSAFAGGMSTSTSVAPSAMFSGTYSQEDGLTLQHTGGDILNPETINVYVILTQDFSTSPSEWKLDKTAISQVFPAPGYSVNHSSGLSEEYYGDTWQYVSADSGIVWTKIKTFSAGDAVYVNPAMIQPETAGTSSSYNFNAASSTGKRFKLEVRTTDEKVIGSTEILVQA